MAGRLTGGCWA